MGQSGCDLYLSPAARTIFPYGVECKAQERIALPAWWEQSIANAERENLTPLLVFRQNRKEALAVLRWSDLLEVLATTTPEKISSSAVDCKINPGPPNIPPGFAPAAARTFEKDRWCRTCKHRGFTDTHDDVACTKHDFPIYGRWWYLCDDWEVGK